MRRTAVVSVVGAILVSCNSPSNPSFEGGLQADITSDIGSDPVVHYSGNAGFHAEAVTPINNNLPLFKLTSRNRRFSRGLPTDGFESLAFEGWRRRPKEGAHGVSDRPSVFTDTSLTWMTYQRAIDGDIESYSSTSGTLEITYSSDELIEGTFAFEGLLYCRIPQDPDGPREGPCDPMTLDPSRARIRVVGWFVAPRIRFEEWPFINQRLERAVH